MQPNLPDKKWLEKAILEIILTGLESKEIDEQKAGFISQYVLDSVDTLQTPEQVADFIKSLEGFYTKFSALATIIEGKQERQEELQAAQQISQLIKQGNVQQALNTAAQEMN